MPIPNPNNPGLGAALDLGLGGQLSQQVADQTDEQRRKRLAEMKGGVMSSPAVVSLLGGYGAGPG